MGSALRPLLGTAVTIMSASARQLKGTVVYLQTTSTPITVFTYRPPTYNASASPLLVVHHGLQRDAEEYRDHSVPMADATGALVIAPLLDKDRFPVWKLKSACVVHDGEVKGKHEWLTTILTDVISEVKHIEGRSAENMPHFTVAHSAGAQLASRMLYVGSTGQALTLMANAGSYLFPSLDLPYPYGLNGLPSELKSDDMLRQYLRREVVVAVGLDDVKQGNSFDISEGAAAQGATRVERGRNFVDAGHRLAQEKGWVCNWSLLEVPGVGHDGMRMLADEPLQRAAFGPHYGRLVESARRVKETDDKHSG